MVGLLVAATCRAEPAPEPPQLSLASAQSPADTSILGPDTRPIDLDSALRLAGVRNPDLMIARERVSEAVARRQLAAVQLLPSINVGTNYDHHTGNLQQSDGTILSVDRQALYAGLGAGAVGGGTVNIPGIVWNAQLSDTIYNCLIASQVVAQQQFALAASQNEILLRVAMAYEELLRAEVARAVAINNRDDNQEVARITAAYARTGQGRKADADRAATELARRQFDISQYEGQVLARAAQLGQWLSLDSSVRLRTVDATAVPATIVPENLSLEQLVAMALLRRPELEERRAVIRQAVLAWDGARATPLFPTVLVGFSAGTFGGGSNLAPSEWDSFAGRTDFDVVAYWTLRNLGAGNAALVREAASRVRTENYQLIRVLNQVRDEVAEAYARTQAALAQIAISEQAVRSAQAAFTEDLTRIRGQQGLPIEVLDSLRLLNQGRIDYLNAIVDYNVAQFQLYVALGQPPCGNPPQSSARENIPAPAPSPVPK